MPQDVDLERIALGYIMVKGAFDIALSDDDLYLEAHRKILGAIRSLADRNTSPDLLTVSREMASQGTLEQCGGVAYLASLSDGVPNFKEALAGQYLGVLREKAALRTLLRAGNTVVMRAYECDGSASIIEDAEREFDAAAAKTRTAPGLVPVGDLLDGAVAQIEAASGRQAGAALPLGFTELDRLLGGGVRKGQQTILAGRPGTGKTAFLLSSAANLARAGARIGVFSLEMGANELVIRMLAAASSVDMQRIRTGFVGKEDWTRLTRGAAELSPLPVYVDDSTGIGVHEVKSRVRRVREPLDVVMVDYLQLVSPERSTPRNATENERIAAVSVALKFAAKSMGFALVCASQLSRASERRTDRRPQLADLRSSGQLEQDADVVVGLYRPEMDDPSEENIGIAEAIVLKQRDGPTGTVRLAFVAAQTAFANLWVGP